MTRLLLVRHGQSEWNAAGRWQGQEDPPLTDLGRTQAVEASRAIGAVDGIFASPLQRASATAAIIAEQIGVGPVLVSDGLMERNAGQWQGMTRTEIESSFPGYLAQGRRPSGWEDDSAVEARALAALDAIAELHPTGHLLAVAHAGIVFAIERVLGAEWERLANLSGRWLERDESGWQLRDRVHLLIEETIPDQI